MARPEQGASERRRRRGGGQDRAGRRELSRSPGPSLPMSLPPDCSARHPPISLRRGDAKCPKPRAAPPAEVAANRERGPGAVRPRAPRTAPSGRARVRGCPARCPAPAGHVRSPRLQRRSAKVGLQFCRWEVGDKIPGQSG
ncbi:hypothetical protein mRhiFer1_008703 [Rhinolophus ferrumequinum]|uniref:Uncharacterized protein n=1 Tax=Rhinolophus ferrumequinum TaxID=59479 RepID=A0A7J7TQ87_RHIFE|nr:hypothetical protein mRhiFer1_008703 [Rhinolophus ferrumequinum]